MQTISLKYLSDLDYWLWMMNEWSVSLGLQILNRGASCYREDKGGDTFVSHSVFLLNDYTEHKSFYFYLLYILKKFPINFIHLSKNFWVITMVADPVYPLIYLVISHFKSSHTIHLFSTYWAPIMMKVIYYFPCSMEPHCFLFSRIKALKHFVPILQSAPWAVGIRIFHHLLCAYALSFCFLFK